MSKRYTVTLKNTAGTLNGFMVSIEPGESLSARVKFWIDSENIELQAGDKIIIEEAVPFLA